MSILGPAELLLMRESGRIVRRVLDELRAASEPGTLTADLDRMAREMIETEGGTPSFLGLRGYPASICCSINEQVVHGIPGDRTLSEGDLVSIDVGVLKNGFHADAADSFILGEGSGTARRLLEATYAARDRGIEAAVAGNRLGDVGAAIQEFVEAEGFSVVRDLVGHGIGQKLHEPPQVPNFGRRNSGMILEEGLAIAIEPMVNVGTFRVRFLSDGWTVVTQDGSLSAHAEHTVVVTAGTPIVLTA
ncbi:type I methionyl aminopeptidase [Candidatus Fermentibacterales bacterium]|nr:type I methionyl aminopeptidase [Candidatus Fermentibacterales bacterium]